MDKKRILVIDDEQSLVELITRVLEKEGYQIISEATSSQGLDRAKSSLPDLIILDLNLPGVGGIEVCRLLKEDKNMRNIPVLILSVKSAHEDKIAGLKTGADDYLTKPFHGGELTARVEALLRRADGFKVTEEILRSGELVVNIPKHEVTLKGKIVELRPKEFNLLSILMRKKGKVFSRTFLVEAALGYESIAYNRVIDSHIKNLRKRLGKAGEKIKTVRDLGYKFDDI